MSRSPAVHTDTPRNLQTPDSPADNGMRLNQAEDDKSMAAMLVIAGMAGLAAWVLVIKGIAALL